jgi:hypothetical protein
VKLSSNVLSGPIYWLATGAVTISGTLDLSGDSGHADTNVTSARVPAAGGAGGYSGGVGGALVAGSPNLPVPQPGDGPGGGVAPTAAGTANGGNGSFTGSQYLIPLIGGSGGGGGSHGVADGFFGGGGSGGGGAILIASSVSITLGGTIKANGGAPGGGSNADAGGAGSGGAVRLIAPTISDSISGDGGGSCGPDFGRVHGSIEATGPNGNNGIIRLEAFNSTIALTLNCVVPAPLQSTPFNVALLQVLLASSR